jgi:hypothetical protein
MDSRADDIVVVRSGQSVLVEGEELILGVSGAHRVVAGGFYSRSDFVHGESIIPLVKRQ